MGDQQQNNTMPASPHGYLYDYRYRTPTDVPPMSYATLKLEDRAYILTPRPSKPFNHANELNKHILKSSHTRELCYRQRRTRPDRQAEERTETRTGPSKETYTTRERQQRQQMWQRPRPR